MTLPRVNAASQRAIERTINDWRMSREAFENTKAEDLAGERSVVDFFETVYDALEQFEEPGDDKLTNRYFNLLSGFIDKFSPPLRPTTPLYAVSNSPRGIR